MSGYELTVLANEDLGKIWRYIAADSAEAADRVEASIYAACGLLAASPMQGHSRRDLTPRNLLFWTVQPYTNYTVVYRPDTDPLLILGVFHGARHIKRLLHDRFN